MNKGTEPEQSLCSRVCGHVAQRICNRTAHLSERRKMMQQWADYLDTLNAGAEVIPLRQRA